MLTSMHGKSIVFAFLLSPLLTQAVAAGNIERVDDQTFDDRIELIVEFSEPLTYLSHEPRTEGGLLTVNLRPFLASPDRDVLSDDVDPPPALSGLVSAIRYDGSGSIHRLILDVNRPVDVDVISEADGQRLRIILPTANIRSGQSTSRPVNDRPETFATETSRIPAIAPAATLPALPTEALEKTWQDARTAITNGDYPLAIRLYTELLQRPDHQYTRLSQEYLGLASERNGQEIDARTAYETYLARYPDGDDANRVRQRLAGLGTARAAPKGRLRQAKRPIEDGDWDIVQYSGLSAFYIFREDFADGLDDEVVQNDILTDFDYTVRARNGDYDIQGEVVVGHALSLIDTEDDEFALSALNVEAASKSLGLSGTIGRQREGSHGIFSRFDGGFVGYQILDGLKINGFAGFPVDRRSDGLKTNRHFYGGSFELEPFGDAWDFTVYGIQQEADGILDRQAVGTDIRFASDQFFAFGLIDHDISYNTLNVAQASGTWLASRKATITLAADYRKSPFLTTSNALLGQDADELEDLLQIFAEDDIRDLAEDRTADAYSATFGGSYQLNPQLVASGDLTAARLSATDASGGVDATDESGVDLFYNGQLVATNVLTDHDITALGLRFADTDFGRTVTGDLNFRYSLNTNLRLNPRLRADYRFGEDNRGALVRFRPSVAVDYRFRRNANLQFEVGGEWANEEFLIDRNLDGNNDDEDVISSGDFFLLLGTRLDF